MPKIKVIGQTVQIGERPQTNGRTHGCYQTYYGPCYAVDDQLLTVGRCVDVLSGLFGVDAVQCSHVLRRHAAVAEYAVHAQRVSADVRQRVQHLGRAHVRRRHLHVHAHVQAVVRR